MVDLPQPDSPTIPKVSPSYKLNSTPLTALTVALIDQKLLSLVNLMS